MRISKEKLREMITEELEAAVENPLGKDFKGYSATPQGAHKRLVDLESRMDRLEALVLDPVQGLEEQERK